MNASKVFPAYSLPINTSTVTLTLPIRAATLNDEAPTDALRGSVDVSGALMALDPMKTPWRCSRNCGHEGRV